MNEDIYLNVFNHFDIIQNKRENGTIKETKAYDGENVKTRLYSRDLWR